MKIKPIITEKSLKDASTGSYTFIVARNLTKWQIKKAVNEVFGVHTQDVRTINYPSSLRKNYMGRKIARGGYKKAVVTLRAGEKLDLFETKKGKAK